MVFWQKSGCRGRRSEMAGAAGGKHRRASNIGDQQQADWALATGAVVVGERTGGGGLRSGCDSRGRAWP